MTASERIPYFGAMYVGASTFCAWRHPETGSNIGFGDFLRFARTAERGLLDFIFLAEGLSVGERNGRFIEETITGRPDSIPLLSALAAVTKNIGLAATLSTTHHNPYELARQLATLDHLSGGRVAWNVVTSSWSSAGSNFRRGNYLAHEHRYTQADEFLEVVLALWDSWKTDGTGLEQPAAIDYSGQHFDLNTAFALSRPPQPRPVIMQAGGSPQGRDFAAHSADLVFSVADGGFDAARPFYSDVKERTRAAGRNPDEVKILPGCWFVVGDSDADAQRKYEYQLDLLTSPRVAIELMQQLWGRDLSEVDVDGPFPDIEPDWDKAWAYTSRKPAGEKNAEIAVAQWRDTARANNLSIREVAKGMASRFAIVGSAQTVADEIERWVDGGACDGFINTPALLPGGLDEFSDLLIPELQRRGRYRTEYEAPTMTSRLEHSIHG